MLFKRTREETSGTRRGMISSVRAVQGRLVTRRMKMNLGPQFQARDVEESAVVVPVRPAVVGQVRAAVEGAKRRCPWAMATHNG